MSVFFSHCYILYASLSLTSMSLIGFTCKLVRFSFFLPAFLYTELVGEYLNSYISSNILLWSQKMNDVLISVMCILFFFLESCKISLPLGFWNVATTCLRRLPVLLHTRKLASQSIWRLRTFFISGKFSSKTILGYCLSVISFFFPLSEFLLF